MARKKKHEEHENHERWLVSYADFITLLFAFFVVMYSLSSVNEGKYRVLSESLVAAFNSPNRTIQPVNVGEPPKGMSIKPPPQPGQPAPQSSVVPPVPPIQPPAIDRQRVAAEVRARIEAERAKTIAAISDQIEKALAPLIDKDLVHIRRARMWLEVEINTSILFPSGSAALSASAIPTLQHVAEILGRYPNPIHVEGFTDNRPIKTVAFPSNWELSAARAASVVHLFSSTGIVPERMAAVGYGEYHSVGDNSTREGRNANRRVVLVVLADPNVKRLRDQAPENEAAELEVPPEPPAVAPTATDGGSAGNAGAVFRPTATDGGSAESANAPDLVTGRTSSASRASVSARGPADVQDARMPRRPGMAESGGLDPIGGSAGAVFRPTASAAPSPASP